MMITPNYFNHFTISHESGQYNDSACLFAMCGNTAYFGHVPLIHRPVGDHHAKDDGNK